jgi:hypothetical protein
MPRPEFIKKFPDNKRACAGSTARSPHHNYSEQLAKYRQAIVEQCRRS